MITLPYSLVIEATEDPDFFGFYSADLDGFTGIGHSIEGDSERFEATTRLISLPPKRTSKRSERF